MPDEVGALAQLHALELAPAARVKETELDARRVLGEEREVDARPVPGRAERVRAAAPDGARRYDRSCGRLHRRRSLRRNGQSAWHEVAACGAPAPILLPLHGVVGEPVTTGAIGELHRLHGVRAEHYG